MFNRTRQATTQLKKDEDWEDEELSINDELELFFRRLLDQEQIEDEFIRSFFTPKLTQNEMNLVEIGKEDFLKSFGWHYSGANPDVDPEELKKSDSKAKFVHGRCYRYTTILSLPNKKKTINCCNTI